MDSADFKPMTPFTEMTPEERLREVRFAVVDAGILFPDGEIPPQAGWRAAPADLAEARAWRAAGRGLLFLSPRACPELAELTEKALADWALCEEDKEVVMQMAALERGFEPVHTCYLGRDLSDLAAMRLTGYAAAPADAHPWVREVAYMVGQSPSGPGALAEILSLMLAGGPAED